MSDVAALAVVSLELPPEPTVEPVLAPTVDPCVGLPALASEALLLSSDEQPCANAKQNKQAYLNTISAP